MSARESLLDFLTDMTREFAATQDAYDNPEKYAAAELDAYRAEVLKEAAEKILADLEWQEAGGQYASGMKRAAFLVTKEVSE